MNEYRSQIGCVLQDDRLFAGSIADNIAGFAESVDRKVVETAASLAAIHDEIARLPMGYETLVGDMGAPFPADKYSGLFWHARSIGGHACSCWMRRQAILMKKTRRQSTGRFAR